MLLKKMSTFVAQPKIFPALNDASHNYKKSFFNNK